MVLIRLIKELLGGRRPALRPEPRRESAPVPSPSFVRSNAIPSVLVLTHSYRGNGAAEMLMFLLRWLVRDLGWQVTAFSDGLPEADKEALTELGVGLVEAVDPGQYDVAIANTVVSGLAWINRLGGSLPCLLWVHEGETVLWDERTPVGYWKRAFAISAHVVFQSRWQAERIFGSFVSGLPESRYSVILNCLPTLPETGALSFPVPAGKKRIVFLGSVYPRKRPEDLVRAVQELRRDDVECVLVGSCDYLDALPESVRSALKTDKRFRLTGELSRNEATAYLASADVLSLPSGDESQPLVLLEAAHFNVPVVISDLPVYRDAWVHGENCLKHAVGDIVALAGHLDTCLAGKGPAPTILNQADVSRGAFLARFEGLLRGLLPAGRFPDDAKGKSATPPALEVAA